MQRFANLTKVQALKTIQVCEGPLTAESKINSITQEEFVKKFGFEYTEDLVCNSDLSESDQKEILAFATAFNPDIRPEQVLERTQFPLTNLVLCKLDDPVGYSVMTSERIPRNTIIGFYHGILIRNSESYKNDNDTGYTFSITQNFSIDAEIGGLMRFMAHLPNATPKRFSIDDDMTYINFIDEDVKNKIAIENTSMMGILIDGRIYIAVYTTQDIPPFSVVGISYGVSYFKSPRSPDPKLIFPNGTLVPETSYRYQIKPDKNTSPFALYQTAVEHYNKREYFHSIMMLEFAIPLFKKKFGDHSAEVASCYSTMASSYRELEIFSQAINFCLEACKIFMKLDKTEKLNPVVTKLKNCIDKFNTPENKKKLFHHVAGLFKNEEYKVALIVLEYIQPHFQGKDLALCFTSIALCYEKLGELDKFQLNQYRAGMVAAQLTDTTEMSFSLKR